MDHDIVEFSGIFSAIFIGLIIGLRHSTDGDHVVAVSTMARDYRSVFKGLWVGVSWGLGHSTPLLILGVIILLIKQSVMDFYDSISGFFEFGVAIMLVFLGLQVFWKMYQGEFHIHEHEHDGDEHKHLHGSHGHETDQQIAHDESKHGPFPELIPFFRLKSYAIGLVHGLAGSAAVLLAILPTTPDFISGFLFLLFFSIGTMISMALMTIILSLPFAFSSRSNSVGNVVISFAGLLSVVLGCALGSDIVIGTDFTGYLWY
tara:strand:- start:5279 stop:6058 length:780 start_codon:yes stop_codon:yes gene_type:complete